MQAKLVTHPEANHNLEGATLVLPTPSFGNVSQLTVDLLVNTWELPSVGHIVECNLLPCFGGPAYEFEATPSTDLQLFGQGELYVVQQRSPAALGREEAFAVSLGAWIGQAGFKQVILMGSIDAAMRTGSQLEGSQLRYRSQHEDSVSACHSLGIKDLEARDGREVAWDDMLLPPWPMWRALQQQPVHSTLLVTFAGEGLCNESDAAILASLLQAVLHHCSSGIQDNKDWVPPVSWSHLFGNSLVEEIY